MKCVRHDRGMQTSSIVRYCLYGDRNIFSARRMNIYHSYNYFQRLAICRQFVSESLRAWCSSRSVECACLRVMHDGYITVACMVENGWSIDTGVSVRLPGTCTDLRCDIILSDTTFLLAINDTNVNYVPHITLRFERLHRPTMHCGKKIIFWMDFRRQAQQWLEIEWKMALFISCAPTRSRKRHVKMSLNVNYTAAPRLTAVATKANSAARSLHAVKSRRPH